MQAFQSENAGVAELADALDSKSGATLGSARPIDVLLTLSRMPRPASQDRASLADESRLNQCSARCYR